MKAFIQDYTCPLDGFPCEKDCPDRDHDDPRGGCILCDVSRMGGKIINFGGGDLAVLLNPGAIGL